MIHYNTYNYLAFIHVMLFFEIRVECPLRKICYSHTCPLFTSELEQRLVNTGMEILGLYSQLTEDSKWAPLRGRISWYFLHSFMTTIGAGTSEVGRSVIAQRGLGLPRAY